MAHEANVAILKESLQSIIKQLDLAPKARQTSDIKASVTKVHNILLQENSTVERFYFIYLTCQICINAKPAKVEKFVKVILPIPSTVKFLPILEDLISFALCHSSVYSNILDTLSAYLDALDVSTISVESWHQSESLALDSPGFCSALVGRPDLPHLGIEKKLLARWLQDMSKIDREFPPPSLNQLIKYSLFSELPDGLSAEETHKEELANSDLHLGILTLIQCKRCQSLTNQFLIEVVGTLSQKIQSENISKQQSQTLVDRLAQILSVAVASKVTTITNALKNSLSKLSSNQLIASVIQWQNK